MMMLVHRLSILRSQQLFMNTWCSNILLQFFLDAVSLQSDEDMIIEKMVMYFMMMVQLI
uniref:Uncharacterized protein n=1 Tax=Arundo donax TaxID=35708 RepID=A0A0A8ZR76_ARUDO